MKFNKELYIKYLRTNGRKEKDGFFDVIRYPNGKYCFATEQWLGDNGEIEYHHMLWKKFRRKSDGKLFTVDKVCIHWFNCGYFYHASLRDEKGSHATCVIGNINSKDDFILDSLMNFNLNYEQI